LNVAYPSKGDVLARAERGTSVHGGNESPGTSWAYPEANEITDPGLGRPNMHQRVVIQTWGFWHTSVWGAHQAVRDIEWEFDRA
jgi:hypothetical protein